MISPERLERYYDVPYRERGSDFSGAYCWGLVSLFYREEFGIAVPDYTQDYLPGAEVEEIRRLSRRELDSWREVHVPETGDVVLVSVRRRGEPEHCGIYVQADGKAGLLNVRQRIQGPGCSSWEPLDRGFWSSRVVGIYRHVERLNGYVLPAPSPFALPVEPDPDAVTVLYRDSLGRGEKRRKFAPGRKLSEIVAEMGVPRDALVHARLNDLSYPLYAKPKAGTVVTLIRVPQTGAEIFAVLAVAGVLTGGAGVVTGNELLTQIGFGLLGAGVGGPLGASAGSFLGFSGGALIGGQSAALAGASFGGLAGSAIGAGLGGFLGFQSASIASGVRPETPRFNRPDQSPRRAGGGNRLAFYEPVPVNFGVTKAPPHLAAFPFTFLKGDTQFTTALYVVGVGRHRISEITVNGVAIEEMVERGAQYEVLEGGVVTNFATELLDGEPDGIAANNVWRLSDASGNFENAKAGNPVLVPFGGVTREMDGLQPIDSDKACSLDGVDGTYLESADSVLTTESEFILGGLFDTSGLFDGTFPPDPGDLIQPGVIFYNGRRGFNGYGLWAGADGVVYLDLGGVGLFRVEASVKHLPLSNVKGETIFGANFGTNHKLFALKRESATWTVYVDGEAYTVDAPAPITSATTRLRIGGVPAGNSLKLTVDEFFTAAQAWPDSEIAQIWDLTLPGNDTTRGGLGRVFKDQVFEVAPSNARFPTPALDGGVPSPDWRTTDVPGQANSRIEFDLQVPGGVFGLSENGGEADHELRVGVQYRRRGDPASWLNATTAAGFTVQGVKSGGNQFSIETLADGSFRLRGYIRDGFFVSASWPVVAGAYQVRFRADDQGNQSVYQSPGERSVIVRDFTVIAVRGLAVNRRPVNLPGASLIGIEVPSDSFGELVCKQERLLPVFDPTDPEGDADGFTPARITRNAVDAVLATMLESEINGRAATRSQVRLAEFQAWRANAKNFDLSLDTQQTAEQVWSLAANTSDGFIDFIDGKWGVVEHKAQTTPTFKLSPVNSRGFIGRRRWNDEPHAIRARYTDADKDFGRTEVLIPAPGFFVLSPEAGKQEATKFETIEVDGLTSREDVIDHVRKQIKARRLRVEEFELEGFLDAVAIRRGDFGKLQHTAALIGMRAADIVEVTTDMAGDVTHVRMHQAETFADGTNYAVEIRLRDGSIITADIVNPAAGGPDVAEDNLQLQSAFSGSPAPEPGCVMAVGIQSQVMLPVLCWSAEPNESLTTQLRLIPYAADVFDPSDMLAPRDAFVTPPRPPQLLQIPGVPRITEIVSDESVILRRENQVTIQMKVTVRAGHGIAPADQIRVRYRIVRPDTLRSIPSWRETPPQPLGTPIHLEDVQQGALYEIQAQALGRTANSPWSGSQRHLVQGIVAPPPDVVDAFTERGQLRWLYPQPPADLAGFRVRWRQGATPGIGYDIATPVAAGNEIAGLEGIITGQQVPLSLFPERGTVTIFVKAVDLAGNESVMPASVVLRIGEEATMNVVSTIDHRVLGWPGTLTGGTRSTGEGGGGGGAGIGFRGVGFRIGGLSLTGPIEADLQATDGTGPRWTGEDGAPVWTGVDAAFVFSAMSKQVVYTADFTPGAEEIGERLVINVTVEPRWVPWRVEYREAGPDAMWSANGSKPRWTGNDAALVFDGREWSDWRPLPGYIQPKRKKYQFRLTVDAARAAVEVTEFSIEIDVADRSVHVEDQIISTLGSRLKIGRGFREVTSVQLTLQDDPSHTATAIKLLDKNPFGPLVIAEGGSAKIDADVVGWGTI